MKLRFMLLIFLAASATAQQPDPNDLVDPKKMADKKIESATQDPAAQTAADQATQPGRSLVKPLETKSP